MKSFISVQFLLEKICTKINYFLIEYNILIFYSFINLLMSDSRKIIKNQDLKRTV